MPTYEYEHCGHRWESVVPIDLRRAERCGGCGELADLRVSMPATRKSFMPYFDPHLGQQITSPGQRTSVENEMGVVATGEYKHLDDIPIAKSDTEIGTMKDFEPVYHEVVNAGP